VQTHSHPPTRARQHIGYDLFYGMFAKAI
jgi:hypothetical protein